MQRGALQSRHPLRPPAARWPNPDSAIRQDCATLQPARRGGRPLPLT